MHYLIKEIIEAYIEEIDNNDFKELYSTLDGYISHEQLVPLLTETLLRVGINPLDHLEYIPPYYLYNNGLMKTLNIRAGIKSIGTCAFGENRELTYLKLPKSCKKIAAYAFSHCYKLKKIIIECPDMEINNTAFYASTEIEEITYYGTQEEWFRLVHQVSEFQAPDILIHCIDGDIKS